MWLQGHLGGCHGVCTSADFPGSSEKLTPPPHQELALLLFWKTLLRTSLHKATRTSIRSCLYFLCQLPSQLSGLYPNTTYWGSVKPKKEGKGPYPIGNARISQHFRADTRGVPMDVDTERLPRLEHETESGVFTYLGSSLRMWFYTLEKILGLGTNYY